MPTILLVRHGQGSFGAADYDVLSQSGHAQAGLTAAELKLRGVHPVRVSCGSLARQRDTATPIAETAGCRVDVDARWNEYDADTILAHHSTSSARLQHSPQDDAPALSSQAFQGVFEPALTAWIAAGADSPSRETWPVFNARVRAALLDVGALLARGETAAVCTSGGVIAAVCVELLALPSQAFLRLNRVVINGAITTVTLGRGGTTLVAFNEHAHLQRGGSSLVTYR